MYLWRHRATALPFFLIAVRRSLCCTCLTLLACVTGLRGCRSAGGVHHLLDRAVLAAGALQRGKRPPHRAAREASQSRAVIVQLPTYAAAPQCLS